MLGKESVAGCAANKAFNSRKWMLRCTQQATSSTHYSFMYSVCQKKKKKMMGTQLHGLGLRIMSNKLDHKGTHCCGELHL